MNIGTIVYVVGNPEVDATIDHEKEIAKLDIKADFVKFVSPTEGYFDINDIWLELVKKGCNKIMLMSALINDDGSLKLTGKELQLRGNV
ncbi:MAG: hypothetical protein JJV88_05685 [Sulfurovum sp.]|nr:hypothetical protein [Sulfurovaceae bacterium]